MPPKRRPHVDEFDLELNERRVIEERQRRETVEDERRRIHEYLLKLRECASVGPESSPEEFLAFELLKVGSLKKVMLVINIVRHEPHL